MTSNIPFYTDGMRLLDHVRGHQFVTKDIVFRALGLYATEDVPLGEKKAFAKFFSPTFTWYACELEPQTGEAFGFVENLSEPAFSEWGYFSLVELGEVFVRGVYVERDLYYDGRIPE